ncbi:MAG TPA: L-histidine N(alpha)-methyltransferase [Steroidobacteraceae bacterium]|nr:L-histidine N(alpha)-methyltransferase [Steroidobacteraceae bacterium]
MRNAIDVARRTQVVPPHASRPLIALVFEGLSEVQKQLPSMLLFDAEGSRLFEQVCAQPEYYLMRAESALLRRHADAIAELVGPQAAIVEYGTGSGRQGELLLDALPSAHSYVPIDVEATQLARAREMIRRRCQALRIHPLCQDFRQYVALPSAVGGARRRVAFFPGSTVGSLQPLQAVALLNSIREAMGPNGGLLVGFDLVKDPAVHERAGNDAAGAMAAFNRNVLARLNREVDATFDLDAFVHRATWNTQAARVDMSLVSVRTQNPTIAGIGVALDAGEEILTSHAHKFTVDGFASLARVAGWVARETWIEAAHSYAVQYLESTE